MLAHMHSSLIGAGLLLSILCAASCPDGGRSPASPASGASHAKAAPAPAYDVTPLLAALGPGQADQIRRQLGLGGLTELTFYDLELALDVAGEKLAGRLVLHYLNRTGRALSALPLLLHPNAPRELGAGDGHAEFQITAARTLTGPAVVVRPVRPTLVELPFDRLLGPGERISVEVRYTGKLRRLPADANDLLGQALTSLGFSGSGAAASDYGLLASGDGLITLASAYPMVAPFQSGSFDTGKPSRFGDLAYGELAHYRVRVTLPAGMSMVSNLLDLPAGTPAAGGQHVYLAVGAGNRDFAMVAGPDLHHYEQQLGDIRVRSVYQARDSAGGRRALETAVRSLRLFQQRFGAYPYRELDVAEATLVGGAGGVEFPGMVLIAGMLYRPPSQSSTPLAHLLRLVGGLSGLLEGLSGRTGKADEQPTGLRGMDALVSEMLFFTVAHEVAHQYFAGLIGADCRRDAGVDEPLAQFAAGEVAREVRGEQAGADLTDRQVKVNYAIYRMLGGADQRVAQPVRDFRSPLAYAAIVYGKAPYFYGELRRRLGKAAFDSALRQATDAHRFRLVTLSEWLTALDRSCSGCSADLARRWFYEQHGDQDLGIDESGDAVMSSLLGQETLTQLKQSLAAFGMQPRDLFRLLMGNLLEDGHAAGGRSGAAETILRELDKLSQ